MGDKCDDWDFRTTKHIEASSTTIERLTRELADALERANAAEAALATAREALQYIATDPLHAAKRASETLDALAALPAKPPAP